MYKDSNVLFEKLSHSKFRSSFHLNKKLKLYVKEKGIDEIKKHAYNFISIRLKPKYIKNDGRQTPTKQVHPVFIAQHATGTCCRKCLSKWHNIPINKELDSFEIDYIVDVIIKYIENEMTSE